MRPGRSRRSCWFFLYGEPCVHASRDLLGGLAHLDQGDQPPLPGRLGRLLARDRHQGTRRRPRQVVRLRGPRGPGPDAGHRRWSGCSRPPSRSRPTRSVGSMPIAALLGFLCVFLFLIWVEVGIWRTIRRFGRYPDVLVLLGIHLALALGVWSWASLMQQYGFLPDRRARPEDDLARRAHLRRPAQRDLHGICGLLPRAPGPFAASSSRSGGGGSTRSPG